MRYSRHEKPEIHGSPTPREPHAPAAEQPGQRSGTCGTGCESAIGGTRPACVRKALEGWTLEQPGLGEGEEEGGDMTRAPEATIPGKLRLGTIFGACRAVSKRSLDPLRPFSAILGPKRRERENPQKNLRTNNDFSLLKPSYGALWRPHGSSWEPLGPSWSHLRASMRPPQSVPQLHPSRNSNSICRYRVALATMPSRAIRASCSSASQASSPTPINYLSTETGKPAANARGKEERGGQVRR